MQPERCGLLNKLYMEEGIKPPVVIEGVTLDFISEPAPGYFSFKGEKCEICIEHRIFGFAVAVYDLEQDLIVPKMIADVPEFNVEKMILAREAVRKAVKGFYDRFELGKEMELN